MQGARGCVGPAAGTRLDCLARLLHVSQPAKYVQHIEQVQQAGRRASCSFIALLESSRDKAAAELHDSLTPTAETENITDLGSHQKKTVLRHNQLRALWHRIPPRWEGF